MKTASCFARVAFVGLAMIAAGSAARAGDGLEYNRDIRPILSENCFSCHGPDSAARKGGLRLDQREAAIEKAAIAPGDPDASEMIARIDSEDAMEVMPPPESHKTLRPEQKEILRRWVAAGAEYQPHWSFLAPERPAPPAVKDEGWVRNPIDRFVLAALEAKGLAPAPEADRRTLARRLSLDLTGLPPEPEAVEAFVRDEAPDAYERYVEGLLNSPAWGEHRARAWLDAARYADTHGYHFDNFREMWTYRDWVIGAFNRNVPYDRFTIEQLAGDLLPGRTLEQQIASGFNRCNMTTNEGGTIPEENLVIYMKDRTETVGQVFLGLTVNCAGCHDHKFDPLSQKEYYELAAFFNNSTQGAMDGNIRDTPPIVTVPAPEDRARWEALPAELAAARGAADERRATARPEFDGWLAGQTPASLAALAPTEGQALRAELRPRGDEAVPNAALEVAGVGDFEKDQPFSVSAWVRPVRGDQSGSIVARMDDQHDFRGWDLWMENGRVGTHLVHRWPEDALKVVANEPVPVNQWTHVALTWDGSGRPEGVRVYYNGRPQATNAPTNALRGTIRTTVPFKVGQRHTTARLDATSIREARVHDRALAADAVARLAASTLAADLLAMPAEARPGAEVEALFGWWVEANDATYRDLVARRTALEGEESAIRGRGTVAHVMQERGEPAMAFVLQRGEYDRRQDSVNPDTPDILPAFPADASRNRLGFAQWLLREDHPLTARVAVNRFWQEVFGQGLVRTAGDFGVSGELPSHPELLDWLAVEFRSGGWDVKELFRLMVTSAAYRQSAVTTPEKRELDPDNRLLSRGPRFRMEAEMVRDAALAAGGLLVEKIGGPSVKPYQPEGVWEAVAMPESNTKAYRRDEGERLYRRSLYTFWKRAAPPASLEVFNAPSRETCTVRRERTNTPLQALVTLNDPQFVEAARGLAQRVLGSEAADDDARMDLMARWLVARPFRAEERAVVRRSLDRLMEHYTAHPADAAELLKVGERPADPSLEPVRLAAWTMLANQLMNLDEVLNK
jgi:mono/diheme cytochrome c family protein